MCICRNGRTRNRTSTIQCETPMVTERNCSVLHNRRKSCSRIGPYVDRVDRAFDRDSSLPFDVNRWHWIHRRLARRLRNLRQKSRLARRFDFGFAPWRRVLRCTESQGLSPSGPPTLIVFHVSEASTRQRRPPRSNDMSMSFSERATVKPAFRISHAARPSWARHRESPWHGSYDSPMVRTPRRGGIRYSAEWGS